MALPDGLFNVHNVCQGFLFCAFTRTYLIRRRTRRSPNKSSQSLPSPPAHAPYNAPILIATLTRIKLAFLIGNISAPVKKNERKTMDGAKSHMDTLASI